MAWTLLACGLWLVSLPPSTDRPTLLHLPGGLVGDLPSDIRRGRVLKSETTGPVRRVGSSLLQVGRPYSYATIRITGHKTDSSTPHDHNSEHSAPRPAYLFSLQQLPVSREQPETHNRAQDLLSKLKLLYSLPLLKFDRQLVNSSVHSCPLWRSILQTTLQLAVAQLPHDRFHQLALLITGLSD